MFREVGVASVQGPKEAQQDTFLVKGNMIGVFDGNGYVHGATVANRVKELFSGLDETILEECRKVGSFALAFSTVAAEINNDWRGHGGGSTATLVRTTLENMASPLPSPSARTAWVGDSPAYSLRIRPDTLEVGDLLRGVNPVTWKTNLGAHNVDNPQEKTRMTDLGYTFDKDYFRRGRDGLQMSRAFGAHWFGSGVIAEPGESWVPLLPEPEDRLVLAVGTDGSLPVGNTEDEIFSEIAEMVRGGQSLPAIASYVTDKNARNYGDNATLVLAEVSHDQY